MQLVDVRPSSVILVELEQVLNSYLNSFLIIEVSRLKR